jgi:rubrerythrin
MTTVETTTSQLTNQQLGQLYQYTVEAYKQFQKLAEWMPNPIVAQMFKQFAVDEREIRDLVEMKIATLADGTVRSTLGADALFQDMLEGDLSDRGKTEFLISREQAMERKLRSLAAAAGIGDRPFLIYIAASKRAHIVELERELELILLDSSWYKREDARDRIIHGVPAE